MNLRRLLVRRKSEPEQPIQYAGIDLIMKQLHAHPPQPLLVEQLAKVAETPDEIRRQKELEADSSMQPFEWASHVYITVYGELRWRCCSNLFTEDHSPWCASPGCRG